jgi:Mg-chelatase subunit ChlD
MYMSGSTSLSSRFDAGHFQPSTSSSSEYLSTSRPLYSEAFSSSAQIGPSDSSSTTTALITRPLLEFAAPAPKTPSAIRGEFTLPNNLEFDIEAVDPSLEESQDQASSITLKHEIRKYEEAEKLFAVVSLTASLPVGVMKKNGLDVVVIADTSTTMRLQASKDSPDSRITVLKKALLELVEQFDAKDRLALLSFNRQYKILHGLKPVTNATKEAFKQSVTAMDVAFGTEMTAPLGAAFALLKTAAKIDKQANRSRPGVIILVTDGINSPEICEEDVAKIQKAIAKEELLYRKVSVCTIGVGDQHSGKPLKEIANVFSGEYATTHAITETIQKVYTKAKSSIFQSQLTCKGVDGATLGTLWYQSIVPPFVEEDRTSIDFPTLANGEKATILLELPKRALGSLHLAWNGHDLVQGKKQQLEETHAVKDLQTDPQDAIFTQIFFFKNTLNNVLRAKTQKERGQIIKESLACMLPENYPLSVKLITLERYNLQKKTTAADNYIEELLSKKLEPRDDLVFSACARLIKDLSAKHYFVNVCVSDVATLIKEKEFLFRLSGSRQDTLILDIKDTSLPRGYREEMYQINQNGELVSVQAFNGFEKTYASPQELLKARVQKEEASSKEESK